MLSVIYKNAYILRGNPAHLVKPSISVPINLRMSVYLLKLYVSPYIPVSSEMFGLKDARCLNDKNNPFRGNRTYMGRAGGLSTCKNHFRPNVGSFRPDRASHGVHQSVWGNPNLARQGGGWGGGGGWAVPPGVLPCHEIRMQLKKYI